MIRVYIYIVAPLLSWQGLIKATGVVFSIQEASYAELYQESVYVLLVNVSELNVL